MGEALGDQVSWDGETSTISIISDKISTLNVHFIDVGQADSIYIQAPNNYDILIDAGNNNDGAMVVEYLKKQQVDDIEILVATHAHEDHIGGLDDVLEAFIVEEIIDSGESSTTKTYRDYWTAVEAEKAKYAEDRNMTFDLGSNIKFEVIETGDGYSNTNDNSVVNRLEFKNIEFLFTGDMEADVEKTILDNNIQADILKVGHHGSKTSSSAEFLKAVKPQIAVISVGKDNSYGHPAPDILDILTSMEIGIYRTDISGTIVISSDGNIFLVNNEIYENVENGWEETIVTPVVPDSNGNYIGNKNTKKFHEESCTSVKKISPQNVITLKTRDEAIEGGYQPCGICKP